MYLVHATLLRTDIDSLQRDSTLCLPVSAWGREFGDLILEFDHRRQAAAALDGVDEIVAPGVRHRLYEPSLALFQPV